METACLVAENVAGNRKPVDLLTRKLDDEGKPPSGSHSFSPPAPNDAGMITCDSCRAACQGLRCGGCRSSYFCNQACQKQAWKSHKVLCRAVGQQQKDAEKCRPFPIADGEVGTEQELREGCIICTSPLTAPTRLPCGHLCCGGCVSGGCLTCEETEQEGLAGNKIEPGNRAEDVHRFVSRASQYLERGSIEYVAIMEHAAAKLDTVIAAVPAEGQPGLLVEKRRRAQVFCNLEQYAEAKELLQQALKIGLETDFLKHGVTVDQLAEGWKENQFRDIALQIAEINIELKDWNGVMSAMSDAAPYLSMDLPDEQHAHRKWLQLGAVALTELGQHEQGLQLGLAAVEANRHYRGVYDPLVKCCTSLGQHHQALLWCIRSVAYETPWDKENISRLKAKLAELELQLEGKLAETSSADKPLAE